MAKKQLDNLVATGALKVEAPSAPEIDGLIRSGEARLSDAGNESLSIESRFDLAYNAAHALSLAALRWHGYRPDKRYIVFQALAHTLDLPAAQWRVLETATGSATPLNTRGSRTSTKNFSMPCCA
jgi:hypothetical protein